MINEMKMFFCSLVGVVGSFIASLFGGWSEDMVTLIIFMAVDFITGLAVAYFGKSTKSETGSLNSKAGWKGLIKKGIILLTVLVAHRLDIALGSEYIRTAVIIGFISNEVISIVENAGLIGVPLPRALTEAIEILKHKDGDDNGEGME